MGFLDRFKKQKEKEVEKATPAASGPKEKETLAAKKEATKVEKPSAKAATKPTVAAREELVYILIRPLVTEKAAVLASMGQYVFMVHPHANRVAVGRAVKAMYGIEPTDVRIQNVRAKSVRFGRRLGKRKAWKKAIVCLPKGKSIDVYAGV